MCYNYIKRCWGQKPWAKIFADELFPAIDEKRFSVLYSEQESRPNTPVNVIVGALIIKEMFELSNHNLEQALQCLEKDISQQSDEGIMQM